MNKLRSSLLRGSGHVLSSTVLNAIKVFVGTVHQAYKGDNDRRVLERFLESIWAGDICWEGW